jgi:hypothetical protein
MPLTFHAEMQRLIFSESVKVRFVISKNLMSGLALDRSNSFFAFFVRLSHSFLPGLFKAMNSSLKVRADPLFAILGRSLRT